MKAVAPIRRNLAVRTFFNLLGPLVNPALPKYQLLGVYNLSLFRLYNYAYQSGGTRFGVVYSMDGYDEISLTSEFKVATPEKEQVFTPEQIGLGRCRPEELSGGDTPEEAARIFDSVLNNTATAAPARLRRGQRRFRHPGDLSRKGGCGVSRRSARIASRRKSRGGVPEICGNQQLRDMDILETITANTRREVAWQKQALPVDALLRLGSPWLAEAPCSMRRALAESETGVIAEFKRRSPSRGWLCRDAAIGAVVPAYEAGGASACSVLTDGGFFGGSLEDLKQARRLVRLPCCARTSSSTSTSSIRPARRGLRPCC